MSVTVTNTDASLQNATLVTTGGNQTIDGLKSFDRGTSAPFAVVAGAAKVPNLDADLLDGEEASDFHDATQLTGAIDATALTGLVPNTSLDPRIRGVVVALTDGATPALNAALGKTFVLIAAGDREIAVPSNATDGQPIIIRHNASGGARTLTLNTSAGGFRFSTDIPALTQTASGKTDYIGAIYNATDTVWDVVAYSKGS